MATDAPPSAPERELRELRARLRCGNADLYRHLALYLQVLRQVLPARVERATFYLATQIQPQRYAALPDQERRQFHRRLSGLLHRCSSLLTVEQLCSLASQMARERRRQERRQSRLLLQRLSADGPRRSGGDGPGTPASASIPPPAGSVNLDRPDSFRFGLLPVASPPGGAPAADHSSFAAEESDPDEADDLQAALESFLAAGLGRGVGAAAADGSRGNRQPDEPQPPGEAEDPADPSEEAQVQPSAALPAENAEEEDPFGALPELPTLTPLLQRWIAESSSGQVPGGSAPDPWRAGELPDEPPLLLRWLEGVERALARRLRNLSHAINVELLRVGLCSSLLPVSLLDAVLAGQIEPQPAPPNLLRLQLPFPSDDASPVQVIVLLLRTVDLELEEPRLRTCRRRVQQHRQEVRRMAQQFRRLQRRREAHEAEQLWLQDRRASLSPPG